MQVFYAPDISGGIHILGRDESKHIIKVLRMTKGASVMLIDGRGNLYEGAIEEPDAKMCSIRITGVTHGFEKKKLQAAYCNFATEEY